MNKAQFFTRINRNSKPVIVDLWAPWCGPCRAMEPAFKQVNQKYASQVDVWKINADESPDVLKALGVMGIPTVIAFAQGKEIFRRTGLQSAQGLDVLFDAALNGRKPEMIPLTTVDRVMRISIGTLVLLLGWILWHSYLMVGVGVIVLFSAVYDRCPIYRAIAPRIADLFHHSNSQE